MYERYQLWVVCGEAYDYVAGPGQRTANCGQAQEFATKEEAEAARQLETDYVAPAYKGE